MITLFIVTMWRSFQNIQTKYLFRWFLLFFFFSIFRCCCSVSDIRCDNFDTFANGCVQLFDVDSVVWARTMWSKVISFILGTHKGGSFWLCIVFVYDRIRVLIGRRFHWKIQFPGVATVIKPKNNLAHNFLIHWHIAGGESRANVRTSFLFRLLPLLILVLTTSTLSFYQLKCACYQPPFELSRRRGHIVVSMFYGNFSSNRHRTLRHDTHIKRNTHWIFSKNYELSQQIRVEGWQRCI